MFDEDERFTHAVVGFGLEACLSVQDILDSECGARVLHVCRECSYGGCHATLAEQTAGGRVLKDVSRPLLVSPADAVGRALIKCGMGHAEFVPVRTHTLVYDGEDVPVPLSKEAVMLEPRLSLVEKRLLMRAYTEGATDALSRLLATNSFARDLIVHAVGMCDTLADALSDPDALRRRLDEYARAVAAHGGMLYPMGGSASVPEALARAAALTGRAVHMLGQSQLRVSASSLSGEYEGAAWHVAADSVREFGDDCGYHARCVLVESPVRGAAGCAMWTMRCGEHAAHCLQVDAESGCVSRGMYIVYAWSRDQVALERICEHVCIGH